MLVLLKKEKKEVLIEYCVERFGISKVIFENYQLYEGSKNKIYLIKELLELRFIPESSGLCIFRFDKTPKPTTNFLQLFSADISKNVLDIGAWCGTWSLAMQKFAKNCKFSQMFANLDFFFSNCQDFCKLCRMSCRVLQFL